MTMWKRWVQGGVLCGLVLGGFVGTAMSAGPPVGEIAQNDHAALAAWFDKEAAHNKQRAKDMTAMADAYKKIQPPPTLLGEGWWATKSIRVSTATPFPPYIRRQLKKPA